MGRPGRVVLVELGPGRGTLMADALRAARAAPGFRDAIDLHLVEASASFRAEQRAVLAAARPTWHADFDSVPPGPLLAIANEFFDALPIHQFERVGGHWRERCVALEPATQALRFAASGTAGAAAAGIERAPAGAIVAQAPAGAIVERAPAREALAAALAARIAAADRGAALIVDYGHGRPGIGDTLQAVRRHRRHGVLEDPGAADLTAHVDFSALAAAARQAGAAVFGPMAQGRFLRTLGIEERAAALRREASATTRRNIGAALDRLTGADGMGTLFKALAIAHPALGAPARLRGAAARGGSMIAPLVHALLEDPGGRIRHGFFGRGGGVSEGLYRSLNCGQGSGDDPEAVQENRARAMAACGLPAASLCTAYQVHSADALAVTAPWARHDEAPRVDAMATATPGLALAILTADCVPVLLADRDAGVIGAAHAGWRGALNGVCEAAVAAMLGLGACASGIRAVIGPAIGKTSYEVGPEFPAPFLARRPEDGDLFAPLPDGGRFRFDIAGYVARRLAGLGLGAVAATGGDTCAEAERFFSYRRSRAQNEPDYGRHISIVALNR